MTESFYPEVASLSTRALVGLARPAASLPPLSGNRRAMSAGPYQAAFKGRGMEFDEVRPYEPGDDIRTLDWKVTARTGSPHTKLFREERERPVVLCLDLRSPMFFATRGAFKSVVASYMAVLLAWNAHQGGDRVGGVLFDDQTHRELKPLRGRSAVLHFIESLTTHPSWSNWREREYREQALGETLARMRNVAKPGTTMIILSDFRGLDTAAARQLVGIGQHTSTMLIQLYDPLEAQLPPPARYRLSDRKKELQLDTAQSQAREDYANNFQKHCDTVESAARGAGMRHVKVSTEENPVRALVHALMRTRRQSV